MHSLAELSPRFLALALFSALGSILYASPTPLSYTLDLPVQANLATPTWLGHPESPVGTFASLNLPLTAPAPGESLLVTISFQEKEGGFIRLSWKGDAGEQELSSNFYEGVAMNNQRTLLIPASVVSGAGTLCLQCGDTSLDVQKIHLEWLEDRTALVSPERTDEEVVSRLGKISIASSLDGQASNIGSAMLDGQLVTVPILPTAQRIEQGVEFRLQLDGAPQAARLSFKESGLPWGDHVVLWINQKRAGTITPTVPDLGDTGYTTATDATQPYVGWRDSSIYLPVEMLKGGLNSLQLSVENDDPVTTESEGPASTPPLAVKEMSCQFDYTTVTSTSTPATPPAVTPPAATPPSPTSPTVPDIPAATPSNDPAGPLTPAVPAISSTP